MSQADSANITRRSLVAGLGAAIPATAVPSFAGASPDAELLELGRQWGDSTTRLDAHHVVVEAAERRFFDIRPDMPESLFARLGDGTLGLWHPQGRQDGRYFYEGSQVEAYRTTPYFLHDIADDPAHQPRIDRRVARVRKSSRHSMSGGRRRRQRLSLAATTPPRPSMSNSSTPTAI